MCLQMYACTYVHTYLSKIHIYINLSTYVGMYIHEYNYLIFANNNTLYTCSYVYMYIHTLLKITSKIH